MRKLIFFIFLVFFIIGIAQAENKNGKSPFYLDIEQDLSILHNGFQLFNTIHHQKNSINHISDVQSFSSSRNLNDLNAIDKMAVLPYSSSLSEVSDILQIVLMAAPAGILFNKDLYNITTIAVMYSETILITNSLARFSKTNVSRYRPYSYHYDPDESIPLSSDARNSFFSAHTTTAFTNASFITTVFSSYYPDSPWKYVVGAGSFGIASTIGILRISSGNHFISDVLLGAGVGTLFGWLIPFMHKTDFSGGPEFRLYTDGENNLGISLIIKS